MITLLLSWNKDPASGRCWLVGTNARRCIVTFWALSRRWALRNILVNHDLAERIPRQHAHLADQPFLLTLPTVRLATALNLLLSAIQTGSGHTTRQILLVRRIRYEVKRPLVLFHALNARLRPAKSQTGIEVCTISRSA
jgi:hypothetical protein